MKTLALVLLALAAAGAGPGGPDRFGTPGDTIRCTWAPAPLGFLRCDARTAFAPAAARCGGLSSGDAVRLMPLGRAALYCHGDTAFGADRPRTLAYGATWRGHGISCVARRSGLTCTNRSGHGFALAPAAFRRF